MGVIGGPCSLLLGVGTFTCTHAVPSDRLHGHDSRTNLVDIGCMDARLGVKGGVTARAAQYLVPGMP